MSFGQYSSQVRPPDESKPIKPQAKRMKHVFDNPAHVWAHPRKKDGSGYEQTDARVSSGNWYFKTSSDGTRVMYSYRDSYPIASRFERGRKTIFLLRAGKPYSITTAGHMHSTRHAVPVNDSGVLVFTVPAMVASYNHTQPGAAEHKQNASYYVAEISSLIVQYTNARSTRVIRTTHSAAHELVAEAKRYAKLFRVKLPKLPVLPPLNEAKLARIAAQEETRMEKIRAIREKEYVEYKQAQLAAVHNWLNGPQACKHLNESGKPKHAYIDRMECQREQEREEWERTRVEKIAAWRRGENVKLLTHYTEFAMLRIKDGELETSFQVRVPISGPAGAARLFRFLVGLRAL